MLVCVWLYTADYIFIFYVTNDCSLFLCVFMCVCMCIFVFSYVSVFVCMHVCVCGPVCVCV